MRDGIKPSWKEPDYRRNCCARDVLVWFDSAHRDTSNHTDNSRIRYFWTKL